MSVGSKCPLINYSKVNIDFILKGILCNHLGVNYFDVESRYMYSNCFRGDKPDRCTGKETALFMFILESYNFANAWRLFTT